MDSRRALLGVLAVFPAVAVALYFLAGDLAILLDACHFWAGEAVDEARCARGHSQSSQTLGSYLFTMLWVKGGILLGAALGVAGLGAGRRWMVLAGALALVAVGTPLMLGGTGILVWASALLLALATTYRPPGPSSRPGS